MVHRSYLNKAARPATSAPASSPLARLLRLGSLVGRVGASVAVEQLVSLVLSGPSRQAHQLANLVLNAERIVRELGQLKGAAMKVGQMLSLQDALLPPEVTGVLRALQRQAPPIPFDVVQRQLDAELPGWRNTITRLEPQAIAAASIGQVHRGVLNDGRPVAVKIQYPGIDDIIEADLVNLRRLLQSLFALFTDADFAPVWGEVRDRLREELDYVNEAENLRRMAALWAGSDASGDSRRHRRSLEPPRPDHGLRRRLHARRSLRRATVAGAARSLGRGAVRLHAARPVRAPPDPRRPEPVELLLPRRRPRRRLRLRLRQVGAAEYRERISRTRARRARRPAQRSARAARGDGRHHSLGRSGVRGADRARARPRVQGAR